MMKILYKFKDRLTSKIEKHVKQSYVSATIIGNNALKTIERLLYKHSCIGF